MRDVSTLRVSRAVHVKRFLTLFRTHALRARAVTLLAHRARCFQTLRWNRVDAFDGLRDAIRMRERAFRPQRAYDVAPPPTQRWFHRTTHVRTQRAPRRRAQAEFARSTQPTPARRRSRDAVATHVNQNHALIALHEHIFVKLSNRITHVALFDAGRPEDARRLVGANVFDRLAPAPFDHLRLARPIPISHRRSHVSHDLIHVRQRAQPLLYDRIAEPKHVVVRRTRRATSRGPVDETLRLSRRRPGMMRHERFIVVIVQHDSKQRSETRRLDARRRRSEASVRRRVPARAVAVAERARAVRVPRVADDRASERQHDARARRRRRRGVAGVLRGAVDVVARRV